MYNQHKITLLHYDYNSRESAEVRYRAEFKSLQLVGITFLIFLSHVGCAGLTGMERLCKEKPCNLPYLLKE